MSRIELVNEHTFEDQVLNSPVPVLVDFYADWCAPCRAQTPQWHHHPFFSNN